MRQERSTKTGRFLNEAQRKAERDKKIRETLWPEKKYTVTNAIADPQTGRGVK